jgi:hypothetical protein
MKESVSPMKRTKRVDELISIQWPTLKKRVQSARNLEELIAVFEAIEDLLFNVEIPGARARIRRQIHDQHATSIQKSRGNEWAVHITGQGIPALSDSE